MLLINGISAPVSAQSAPDVVVSIKPIHSLVAGVMRDVAEPTLLVTGAGSPHTYSLKPSQAAALQSADLVFWIGPGLETFLEKPIETLGQKARPVGLLQAAGVTTLLPRDKHDFEGMPHDDHDEDAAHDDHDDHDDHGEHDDEHHHGGIDPHIWLDPQNAIALVATIRNTLSQIDPVHGDKYIENAARLTARIASLDQALKAELAPVADRPFAVFHDAYQYFEKHFELHTVGVLTLHPESRPSAEQIATVQNALRVSNARCVFAEPQFPSRLVDVVTDGTEAKSGILDPLGADLTPGPDLYFQMMQTLADTLRDCLSGAA